MVVTAVERFSWWLFWVWIGYVALVTVYTLVTHGWAWYRGRLSPNAAVVRTTADLIAIAIGVALAWGVFRTLSGAIAGLWPDAWTWPIFLAYLGAGFVLASVAAGLYGRFVHPLVLAWLSVGAAVSAQPDGAGGGVSYR